VSALLPAVLLLVAAAACAAPVASREPQPAGRRAAEEPQVKLGEKAPDPAAARERAIERARKHLSEKLDIPAGEFDLVSANAATWSDASLGCPEPDRMYAQVVTEGHEIVLDARGTTHVLHVGPKRVVICAKKS
jgi:hypothetical protein